MKIEKVNDHQIRCTLTKADLADRELKISELAYGTEKAKSLFRDMVQRANYEVGFDAEDIPLMVEAIPLSSETIILQITKVEYPDGETSILEMSGAVARIPLKHPIPAAAPITPTLTMATRTSSNPKIQNLCPQRTEVEFSCFCLVRTPFLP